MEQMNPIIEITPALRGLFPTSTFEGQAQVEMKVLCHVIELKAYEGCQDLYFDIFEPREVCLIRAVAEVLPRKSVRPFLKHWGFRTKARLETKCKDLGGLYEKALVWLRSQAATKSAEGSGNSGTGCLKIQPSHL